MNNETIVELPDKMTEYGVWVYSYVDGLLVSSVWGFPEVQMSDGRWLITVWRECRGVEGWLGVMGFIHADAIRRK